MFSVRHSSGSHHDLTVGSHGGFTVCGQFLNDFIRKFFQTLSGPRSYERRMEMYLSEMFKIPEIEWLPSFYDAYTEIADALDLAMIYCADFVADEFRIEKYCNDIFFSMYFFDLPLFSVANWAMYFHGFSLASLCKCKFYI